MHELGIMTEVIGAARGAAQEVGALRVLEVHLKVGEMTEAIRDALEFAFEALQELPENALLKGARLDICMVEPRSRCLECGTEYAHDRFHMLCPSCGSFATTLLAGKELEITSVEVDVPDEDERAAEGTQGTQGTQGTGDKDAH